MRAGTGASIGVVTELVDVHATLGRGIAAFDIVGYCGGARLGGLLEGNCTTDGGITAEDCDCVVVEN